MLVYWILFATAACMALNRGRALPPHVLMARWHIGWLALFVVLVLFIGMRHEVGGDWFNYLNFLDAVRGDNLVDAMGLTDPAYSLFNWIGANVWGEAYLVNTLCALLFSWGLLSFCRSQPRPGLALAVAIPYLVTVVAMGYSRQAVAIGLAMLGLVSLARGNITRFIVWLAVGALFHKSAVILIPMALFVGSRHRWLMISGVLLTGALLFVLLVQEAVDSLLMGYVENSLESSGAALRVGMNAFPAVIFLCFRKRFAMPAHLRKFWTYMALSALAFVLLLAVSPSSTAVDRLALYWIPLQLFVWSRLPDAIGKPGRANSLWVSLVVLYSATVLFVWLVLGSHSTAWLPYRFYPWELLF